MKLFDFVNKLRSDNTKPTEKPKKDLGVCVPIHTLSEAEKKKKLADNGTIVDTINKKQKKDDDLEYIAGSISKENYSGKNSFGLDTIGKKETKTKSDVNEEVIIPIKKDKKQTDIDTKDKTKTDSEDIDKEIIQKIEVKGRNRRNTFRVTGLYDFGSTTMLSGIVEEGQVNTKMTAKLEAKKELSIIEIKISSTKVNGLIKGEEGSLFVKSKGNPIIRYDDLIEFN